MISKSILKQLLFDYFDDNEGWSNDIEDLANYLVNQYYVKIREKEAADSTVLTAACRVLELQTGQICATHIADDIWAVSGLCLDGQEVTEFSSPDSMTPIEDGLINLARSVIHKS